MHEVQAELLRPMAFIHVLTVCNHDSCCVFVHIHAFRILSDYMHTVAVHGAHDVLMCQARSYLLLVIAHGIPVKSLKSLNL